MKACNPHSRGDDKGMSNSNRSERLSGGRAFYLIGRRFSIPYCDKYEGRENRRPSLLLPALLDRLAR